MSQPLSELCDLAIEDRTSFVLQHGAMELRDAVRTFGRKYMANALQEEHLAWAVAFNFKECSVRLDEPKTWEQLWAKLCSQPDGEGGPLLVELSLSVACEQRDELWQYPSRKINIPAAEEAFQLAYEKSCPKVEGYLQKEFHLARDRAGEIAQEAWYRIFRDSWHREAKKRFCGLCRISTYVCYIARNLLLNPSDRPNPAWQATPPAPPRSQGRFDADYARCIEQLPPRQQVVIYLLRKEHTSVMIARKLRITEAAVSQRLRNAKANLRECMGSAGYRLAEGK
jgi:RNA polymerase sigma factor (sigma-70 family)